MTMDNVAWGGSVMVGLLGLALGGCGEVHNIPVDQTAEDLAAAVCTKAYDCCSQEQLMGNMDLTGATEGECEVKSADNFRGTLQGVQFSVDKKRSVYLADKVEACLKTLRGSNCETLNMTNHLAGVPSCDSFASPLVKVGGACNNDYECVDSWCKPPPQGTGGDGTCAAFAAADMSCADDQQARCGHGSICDLERDRCVHLGEAGDACATMYDCKSLMCTSQGQGSEMTCAAPPAPGPMCFYASGCSTAGGRPGPVTIVLLTLFAALAIARTRRSRGR
jgi:hypothetical protein